jgi:hypothetical protein
MRREQYLNKQSLSPGYIVHAIFFVQMSKQEIPERLIDATIKVPTKTNQGDLPCQAQ